MKEQWPFPWIYRSFKTHWDVCADRAVPDAWLYYCDTAGEANVESQLTEQFMKIRIMLRQQREYSVVYLKKSLFGELYTGAFQVVGPAKEKE
jgi:hypothetical protein